MDTYRLTAGPDHLKTHLRCWNLFDIGSYPLHQQTFQFEPQIHMQEVRPQSRYFERIGRWYSVSVKGSKPESPRIEFVKVTARCLERKSLCSG